ncbi:mitochondrial enolase superfamily member 1 [Grus japonensis]|uniref:Mitochondrial enolase superfamily member 1 n=1 Tax=Grus japonensis TaxID=30415 RepID=A0ABC9WNF4_GRUJA
MCKQSRRLLKCTDVNFLAQVIEEPTKGDALLDLIGTNKEELFGQPVKVPLDGSTTIWHINYSFQFCTACKLAEVHSVPSSRSVTKMLNSIDRSIDPWGTIRNWPQLYFMSPAVQITFIPPHFIGRSMRNHMQDGVESLTKVKINNIHYSPLIYQATHLIAEVKEGSDRAALVGTWPPGRVNPPQLPGDSAAYYGLQHVFLVEVAIENIHSLASH